MLTATRLTAADWSWGKLNEQPITLSFRFGTDGLIKNYIHENEHSWALEDGILRIFNAAGALTWQFDIMFDSNGQLILISTYHNDIHWRPFFCLIEQPGSGDMPRQQGPAAAEPFRLIIWDLDETFWHGTLSEGPVTFIQSNIDLVRTLNARGIINSICSKNHFGDVKTVMEENGLWDEFVFPEIAFAPKGQMIQRIIENVQLRPETILFIDDNETNLGEAQFYTPKLNIAGPDVIATIAADPRFAGKPDPEKSRLARYKVLEKKATEQAAAGADNEQFLRDCQIRISFHTDIEAQFPRIHDLVNRTNQLNFTKNRWPEDPALALAAYRQECLLDFDSHGGYIKIADRFGSYGICGYYFVIRDVCRHFLFSCRGMNMGVEQFVWNRIKRPQVPVQGDVVSTLDKPVDWITVVPDAEAESAGALHNRTICIRGACDMSMTSNFLRIKVNTLEELTYAWEGWEICSLPRIIALHEEILTPENQSIINQLPGMPPGRFDSDILAGTSDAYVLSFSQESFHGLYRAKSTGMIIPMGHFSLGHMRNEKLDYTSIPYSEIETAGAPGITKAQWDFFLSEFEFLGGFNEKLFLSDIFRVFTLLFMHGKPVIIIGLNQAAGTDRYILDFFANINRSVEPLARQFGFDYIDVNEFVKTEDDLAPDGVRGGAHFARHVYAKIAEAILARLDTRMPQDQPTTNEHAPA
jgi:FkbH-like protein